MEEREFEDDLEPGWIERARCGDTAAFEELVRRYSPRMLSLAYRLMGNRESARDLSQEVFLAAWREIGGFRGESSFYYWLRTIAIHKALNMKKRMASDQETGLMEPGADGESREREIPDLTGEPLARLENLELASGRPHLAAGERPGAYPFLQWAHPCGGCARGGTAQDGKVL
ncbi:MAG: sigma-70 family RNA polymerase sigma factor [Firmicutes bacterium]|nr:sigma-70 family RNA polymerase sigma factor [Bacillota bacterium]